MTHCIVLAVNNPPEEIVDRVVGLHVDAANWVAVWCDTPASLSKLPSRGQIGYVVVGSSGSLTMEDIRPHIGHDLRDVAGFGPGAGSFGFPV